VAVQCFQRRQFTYIEAFNNHKMGSAAIAVSFLISGIHLSVLARLKTEMEY
jgi:hypothetical protein